MPVCLRGIGLSGSIALTYDIRESVEIDCLRAYVEFPSPEKLKLDVSVLGCRRKDAGFNQPYRGGVLKNHIPLHHGLELGRRV